MFTAKRRSAPTSPTAALALFLSCLFPVSRAFAQEPSRAADSPQPVNSQYLQLDHLPSSRIEPADLSLIRARQREIATEAAFFGYNLSASEWDYDEATCPAMPDQLLLHYRRSFSGGAQSLFTAIVPRSAGRVWVVPVLYRNATPFRSATGSERSIAVFNRLVPADIAAKGVQADGKWLAFALCYADIVYGNANILSRPGTEVGLSRAPLPLLHLSEATTARSIVFTDRNAPGEYMVWNLTLNEQGRLIAATAQQLSDYVAKERTGAELTEKPLPPGQEPTVKNLPAAKEPKVVPRPQ